MAENGDVGGGAAGRLGARFAKLWAASTTSALGSGLALIAAPLYVASRTSSPLIVSGATGVAWLPWLLFALPGGVLVDRVDRRRPMGGIDLDPGRRDGRPGHRDRHRARRHRPAVRGAVRDQHGRDRVPLG